MTDVLDFDTPTADGADHGIVGGRELICVQTIDVGRLRSTPVPITPGTFIAVTGRGARGDSNGSGKTTFLGATSLLLGDIGWRPAAGCPEAATLLFDGTKAGVDVERFARAEDGYIIGVFAYPGGIDAITVWMRLRPVAPYIRIRYGDGIRLVDPAGPSELRAQAAATWQQLGKPELGSRDYARKLYGAAPRCMAWLQTRGNETPGKSLLRLSQESLEPDDIGVALLELLGRHDLLEADFEARRDLDKSIRDLNRLTEDDARRRVEEDLELGAITGRQRGRDELAAAQRLWSLHYAQGALEAAERVSTARADVHRHGTDRRAARANFRAAQELLAELGDGTHLETAREAAQQADEDAAERVRLATIALERARTAVASTRDRMAELRPLIAASDGTSLSEARSAVAGAEDHRLDTLGELRRLTLEARHLREAVEAIDAGGASGDAGRAVALLRAAGIDADALLDVIEVDDNARDRWEPALRLFEDAVVVDGDTLRQARPLVDPGAVFVLRTQEHGDGDFDGVTAPAGLGAFLAELSAITAAGDGGATALDGSAFVVGGYPAATTGRSARAEAARQAAADAEAAAAGYERDVVEPANAAVETARAGLATAEAVVKSGELDEQLRREEQALAAAVGEDNEAAAAKRSTAATFRAAIEAHSGYESQRKLVEHDIDRYGTEFTDATLRLRRTIANVESQRRWVRYWTLRWGGDLTSARAAVAAAKNPGEGDRTADSWARAANHALDRALRACGIDPETGEGSPPGTGIELAVTERSKDPAAGDDDTTQLYERQAAAFANLVDALDSWLERVRVVDESQAAFIAGDRDRRSTALTSASSLCDERRRDLPLLQDGIERTIRSLLGSVSDRLDELDRAARGGGADLLVEANRPQTPTDPWEWRVTPRYRRGVTGPPVPYTERANTATEKLLAINLVLAALFASAHGATTAGRVLVLDELGDSLGDFHREAVLRALAETAEASRLTVLGTCQDGVLDDAAAHAGEILYFQFRDPSDILNAPTRVYGKSDDGIVELLGPYVERLS